ncbi:MAG: hypothetical protein IJU57_01390 [Clostridia bacterium]|nr:hypothetical protein [Clostridia bacterium]
MAKCFNCGAEIPENDKTLLCDSCKKIILPFVKLTEASTSSSVRRLISNEKNLRRVGVTDAGMDYLFSVCEKADQRKSQQRLEMNLSASEKKRGDSPKEKAPETPRTRKQILADMELPAEEPMQYHKRKYGIFVTAAEAVLIICSLALLGWFVYRAVAGAWDIPAIVGAAGFAAGAYLSSVLRKMLHDLNELKKRFK